MMDESLLVRQGKQWLARRSCCSMVTPAAHRLHRSAFTRLIHAQPKEVEGWKGLRHYGGGDGARWLAAEWHVQLQELCSCSQDLLADDAAAGCSVGVVGST